MSGSSQDFELDESFNDEEAPFEEESGSKTTVSAKDSLLKRRLIDDLLAERRLQQDLKDLDFDLDDDEE